MGYPPVLALVVDGEKGGIIKRNNWGRGNFMEVNNLYST
jgi:hypothetical protein